MHLARLPAVRAVQGAAGATYIPRRGMSEQEILLAAHSPRAAATSYSPRAAHQVLQLRTGTSDALDHVLAVGQFWQLQSQLQSHTHSLVVASG